MTASGPYKSRIARVCSRLNAAEARYVLVGATAMQLWGTTADLIASKRTGRLQDAADIEVLVAIQRYRE